MILLPLFILVEQRAVDPILHLRLFKSRQLLLASLLSAGAGLTESGVVFIPALAVASFAVTESTASFLLIPLVLALAIGAPLAGRFLDKAGSKLVVMGGTTMITTGILGLSFFSQTWVLFIAANIITGLGMAALLGAPLRYIMLNEARPEDRTVAQGLITILTGVGQLVSGALVGAIAASAGGGVPGYSAAFALLGSMAVVMVLLSLGLKSRHTELATMAKNKSVQQVSGTV
jgi:MFS family permease